MVKIMLILYGSYFIYTFWLSEIIAWHAVLLLIIPFGFHLVLCHHISHKLDAVQNAFNDIPASTEHEFYIEVSISFDIDFCVFNSTDPVECLWFE